MDEGFQKVDVEKERNVLNEPQNTLNFFLLGYLTTLKSNVIPVRN
jgi:hypothetical protein